MRIIDNKPLTIKRQFHRQLLDGSISVVEAESTFDYFQLCLDIVKNPPQQGFKTGDGMKAMKSRIELLNIFESAKKENIASTVLEEHLYEEFMKAYKEWAWAVPAHDVVEFDEYVTGLTKEKA